MLIALDENDNRITATKEIRRARCLCCNTEVIAKTGNFVIWHWSHRADSQCPSSKGKGEFHYRFQKLFELNEIEVKSEKWQNNIADICIYDHRLPDGYLVVELQHSPISVEEVESRNKAYKNILWVVDVDNRVREPRWSQCFNNVVYCRDNKFAINYNFKRYYDDVDDMKEFFVSLYVYNRLDKKLANYPILRQTYREISKYEYFDVVLDVPPNENRIAVILGASWNSFVNKWYYRYTKETYWCPKERKRKIRTSFNKLHVMLKWLDCDSQIYYDMLHHPETERLINEIDYNRHNRQYKVKLGDDYYRASILQCLADIEIND